MILFFSKFLIQSVHMHFLTALDTVTRCSVNSIIIGIASSQNCDCNICLGLLYQCRMDEMMCGERGWRELATMGDTMDQISGRLEGFLWHKHHAENKEQIDDWTPEKVFTAACISCIILFHHPHLKII